MGLQLLLWGVFSPLFGVITDKYGGAVAIFIGFVFYLAGVLFFDFILNPNKPDAPE